MAHLNITPKVDLSGLPQYAANNKVDVVSDAKYVSAENDTIGAQEKNAVAAPVSTPKPEVPAQTTAKKIVPVPARKPLTGQGFVKEMLQRYVERAPEAGLKLSAADYKNGYTTESAWGYPNNTKSPHYQQMRRPYDLKFFPKYRLGMLNGKEEADNNPAAIGYDKDGGYSYGLYQIANRTKSMKGYLNFLAKSKDIDLVRYYNILLEAGGSTGAKIRSDNFEKAWKKLASEQKFSESQKNFILSENYRPLLQKISDIKGLNIEQRHPVIQDILYSMATQHYRAEIPIHKALGRNSDVSNKKAQYNIIHYRYPRERKRALDLLKKKFSGLI